MNKKKAIELLKQSLAEISHLRELHYDNQEFVLWHDNVQNIINAALDPDDYRRFLGTFVRQRIYGHEQEDYQKELERRETALRSIIRKYELLGIETEPSAIAKPKDKTEIPIYLFDNLKLHSKVVEASRHCFVAGNYREAILNAFIGLIDCVKEITGLDLDGDDLMNKVFSLTYDKERRKITKYPIIRVNDLKNSNDRNEQQGFMFLCKGAAGAIRNPKAHKLVTQSNPFHALEYLAFASLLMRRIDEGKLV